MQLILLLGQALNLFAADLPQIDIQKVIELCLKNNIDVEISRLDHRLAKNEIEASSLDFDYFLTTAYEAKRDTTIANLTYDHKTYEERTTGPSIGIKNKIIWGIDWEASLQVLKIRSSSKVAFAKSRYQSAAQIKIEVPLLKEFGKRYTANRYYKAKNKYSRYRFNKFDKANDESFKAIKSYLDVLKEMAILEKRKADLNYSEKIYDFDKRKWKVGKKSKTDLLRTKSQIYKKRSLLFNQKVKVENALIDLSLILYRGDKQIHASQIDNAVLEDDFPSFGEHRRDLKKSYKLLATSFEIKEVEEDLYKGKRESLPELKIEATGSASSIAKKWQRSVDKIFGVDFPSWSLALNFSYPFGAHAASAEVTANTAKLNSLREREKSEYHKDLQKIGALSFDLYKELDKIARVEEQIKLQSLALEYREKAYYLRKISSLELVEEQNGLAALTEELTKTKVSYLKKYYEVKKIENSLLSSSAVN
ncbi:MAG: TolC family protein [Bacteriovoracaceae bacterium]|jgi:outer membrane protein TolC|nr:TolC family protein [Bacteriovoracaceae bacterium]